MMSGGSDLKVLVLGFIFLCLSLALIKILHMPWWAPMRVKHLMGLQGVEGPSYRFIHGSTKEIMSMQKEAMAKPLKELSSVDGSQRQLAVTEPELIKEILSNRQRLSKKQASTVSSRGDVLASSQDEKWAKMRKIANNAFQTEFESDFVA
ncbi:cytochrome P450 CYP749A22-like [Humulus lupulus]|uniref:cytochrome P450 CYP749A22-like n=1 Tax=Humulus lupulus TaxID=3486 RepID=UPI002B4106E1|nr:cytochrome P450 CYP749A22-like [Humulus lupulus]